MVWVWYPATPKAGAKRAEWLPGKWGDLYIPELQRLQPGGPTPQPQTGTAPVRVHAFEDAPAAAGEERFPVLVFLRDSACSRRRIQR